MRSRRSCFVAYGGLYAELTVCQLPVDRTLLEGNPIGEVISEDGNDMEFSCSLSRAL